MSLMHHSLHCYVVPLQSWFVMYATQMKARLMFVLGLCLIGNFLVGVSCDLHKRILSQNFLMNNVI